jgi:hypothetical protein
VKEYVDTLEVTFTAFRLAPSGDETINEPLTKFAVVYGLLAETKLFPV